MIGEARLKIRALIVDDEAPAREELRWLLSHQSAIGEVAVGASATEALRIIEEQSVDVVFLDIEMPDLNGIELARILRRFAQPPLVVFVTAFERHALNAFEVQAIDYVLKPIRTDRLDQTIKRVADALLDARRTNADGPPEPPPSGRLRIPVESSGRTILVERSDVFAVEASRDYVRLHTATKSHLVRLSISALEEEWGSVGFVRVHRSYLVSLAHVKELRSDGAGLTALVGALEIPVSRSYSRILRERLMAEQFHA